MNALLQGPSYTLLQIWNLSDIDRDGSLDADEFAVVSFTHTMAPTVVLIPTYTIKGSK